MRPFLLSYCMHQKRRVVDVCAFQFVVTEVNYSLLVSICQRSFGSEGWRVKSEESPLQAPAAYFPVWRITDSNR